MPKITGHFRGRRLLAWLKHRRWWGLSHQDNTADVRVLEDGTVRITEDGQVRVIEGF